MSRRVSHRLFLATALLGALCFITDASAASVVPTSRGSYCDSGFVFCSGGAGTSTGNHLTGLFDTTEFRSFFVFDLTSVTGPVSSAEMFFTLSPPAPGFTSPDPSETLKFFSVDTTSAAALSGGSAGASGFADLGAGIEYASFTAAPGGPTTLTIAFNSAGIAAINGSLGGTFAFGGAVTTIDGSEKQFIFGDSSFRDSELRLAAVPGPATLMLVGAGFIGLAALRRPDP